MADDSRYGNKGFKMTKEQRKALVDLLKDWDKQYQYVLNNTGNMTTPELMSASILGGTYKICVDHLREVLQDNFEDWSE
jgi:hypothetical protein